VQTQNVYKTGYMTYDLSDKVYICLTFIVSNLKVLALFLHCYSSRLWWFARYSNTRAVL